MTSPLTVGDASAELASINPPSNVRILICFIKMFELLLVVLLVER